MWRLLSKIDVNIYPIHRDPFDQRSTLHQGILKGQRVAFKNTSSSLYKLSQRAIAAMTKSGINHPVIE